MNLHWCISKRTRQAMQAVKGRLMQLHNRAGAQLEMSLRISYVRANDI